MFRGSEDRNPSHVSGQREEIVQDLASRLEPGDALLPEAGLGAVAKVPPLNPVPFAVPIASKSSFCCRKVEITTEMSALWGERRAAQNDLA